MREKYCDDTINLASFGFGYNYDQGFSIRQYTGYVHFGIWACLRYLTDDFATIKNISKVFSINLSVNHLLAGVKRNFVSSLPKGVSNLLKSHACNSSPRSQRTFVAQSIQSHDSNRKLI